MARTTAAKMQISIYQIDTFPYPNMSFDDICGIIIHQANSNEDTKFEEQDLAPKNHPNFTFKIYYGHKSNPPRWRPFFKEIVSRDAPLMKSMNRDSAFIFFIGFKENIFAVSGGHGNFTLQRFSVSNFGMEVLVRLIEKDQKVIKGLQDRGVTGSVLDQRKYFRGDQRISDEDQFGKVYKEVQAELDKKILTEIFGFNVKNLKRRVSQCLVKNSFLLKKRISFEELLGIIERTASVLEKEPNFSLNKVIQISRRTESGKELIKKLEACLIELFYTQLKDKIIPDFDFCHSDVSSYMEAASYKVRRQGLLLYDLDERHSLTEIIEKFQKDDYLVFSSVAEFKYSFLFANLDSYNEENEKITTDTILQHLHGQVSYDGKIYFLLDGEWYKISGEFIKDLNRDCQEALVQAWNDTLLVQRFEKGWKEKDFNSKFIDKPNYLVLDTKVPENIELCDILYYDEQNVYLIHVKKDFNNSIRELTSQISLSARRLKTDIKSDFSFLNKVERSAKRGTKSKSEFNRKIACQNFPAKGLKSLFEGKLDRQIIFCLAFVDTVKGIRSLKNQLQEFESAIAKHSLLEVKREMAALDFGFRVMQINRV